MHSIDSFVNRIIHGNSNFRSHSVFTLSADFLGQGWGKRAFTSAELQKAIDDLSATKLMLFEHLPMGLVGRRSRSIFCLSSRIRVFSHCSMRFMRISWLPAIGELDTPATAT